MHTYITLEVNIVHCFQYIGLFTFGDNVSCDLFQNVTSVGNKKNTYTIWVQKNTNVPVQYEMFGYDSLLGSHYDKYLLTYTNFSNSVDPAMLNISEIAKGDFFSLLPSQNIPRCRD